jgi:FAD/FMN-containing dehydrogenase
VHAETGSLLPPPSRRTDRHDEGDGNSPGRVGARALAALRTSLRGTLLTPGDVGYDVARRVYNGRIDRCPALIARCADAADVVRAVRFARDVGWRPAVRGGGHSAAGHGTRDGGLVIDLSAMKRVEVDAASRVARAQAGLTWGELDGASQAAGLATTGGRISSTGVAGVTLGGGYGWLMRRHGLTVDSLRSVEIVTADGELVTASATEEPDLFWAVRGGGGNFGVVTALELSLHAVGPLVIGGAAFYPAARAVQVADVFRELMAESSDALGAQLNFLIAPPAPFIPPALRGVPVVAIAVCHAGGPADASRDLAPLAALGAPLKSFIKPRPYLSMQRLFDHAGVFGRRTYGRSGHLAALGDTLVEQLVAHAERMTSPLSIVMLSALGGAVARVGEDETAIGNRATACDLTNDAVWEDPEETPRHVDWVESCWAAVRPYTSGVYVNELGDEGEARVREAYPPATYRRLAALKHRYDPRNFFRGNQNISPRA